MSDDPQLTASKLANAITPLVQAGATFVTTQLNSITTAVVASLSTSQVAGLTTSVVTGLSQTALSPVFSALAYDAGTQAAVLAKLSQFGLLQP